MAAQTIDDVFQEALDRYQAGEPAEDLIPVFKDICDQARKSSPAWTCLSWLYLLTDKHNSAYKAAQKAVKLNPQDPQARVNLAISMLETNQKGVRKHIEIAQQIAMAVPELKEELEASFMDGLKRKREWPSLERVQAWIFDD